MSDLIYKRNRKRYLLLILPAFILYTFTLVIPLLGGTFPNALTNWNLMKGTKQFVGLDNYIHLLQDKNFQQAIVFTLILGIVTIIFTNVLAFITAFFLSEKIFGGSISRAMFFLPNIISGVMVSYVWYFIFTRAIPDVGKMLSNHFLSNISWFGTPGWAFAATANATVVSNRGVKLANVVPKALLLAKAPRINSTYASSGLCPIHNIKIAPIPKANNIVKSIFLILFNALSILLNSFSAHH